MAYSVAASLNWVEVAPGKFVKVNRLVAPVLTGSLVATLNVTPGMVSRAIVCWYRLTCVKLPPKLTVCVPFCHVKLSLNCFTGELRREVFVAFWGLEK